MDKYTLSITDNETGKVEAIECEALFAVASNNEKNSTVIIENMNVFDIAVEMAADKNLRKAARVAIAVLDAKQFEDRQTNPIASASIKAIHEEDD